MAMVTITAVIRVRKGEEAAMRRALLAVAEHVGASEPDTLGFFVSQDENDPTIFTTYERFADRKAMELHNGSDVVAHFFGVARPLLDGPVTLITASEISVKS